jgi:hypothetical protein
MHGDVAGLLCFVPCIVSVSASLVHFNPIVAGYLGSCNASEKENVDLSAMLHWILSSASMSIAISPTPADQND